MTIVLDVSFNDTTQQSYDSQNCAIKEGNRKKSKDRSSASSSSKAAKVAKIKNKVSRRRSQVLCAPARVEILTTLISVLTFFRRFPPHEEQQWVGRKLPRYFFQEISISL